MTVGELRAALAAYPQDMEVFTTGTDSGGYDSIFTKDVRVESEATMLYNEGLDFPEYGGMLYVGGGTEED